jgi:hypothetical protein
MNRPEPSRGFLDLDENAILERLDQDSGEGIRIVPMSANFTGEYVCDPIVSGDQNFSAQFIERFDRFARRNSRFRR